MIPPKEDAVVTNAKAAIAEARKALSDPEFVQKLRDGEKAAYESRIKEAEDSLDAYASAGSAGPGALGTAMTRPSPVGGNPVGVLTVAVLAVIGYAIQGSVQSVQQRALTRALTVLSAQHREVASRAAPMSAIDEWILAAGPSGSSGPLRLLMASIFLNTTKRATTLAAVRKDVTNSGACCGKEAKEFEDAAKQMTAAAANMRLVPAREGIRRAGVLLDKILALYKCLKRDPPLDSLQPKVINESSKCSK
jgi:hypothetical protein